MFNAKFNGKPNKMEDLNPFHKQRNNNGNNKELQIISKKLDVLISMNNKQYHQLTQKILQLERQLNTIQNTMHNKHKQILLEQV